MGPRTANFEMLSGLPERGQNWSIFPATRTVAFYSSEAQFIELSEVSSTRLASALSVADPADALKVLPLLVHELRHWLDHSGTVWGRERLASFFDAVNSREKNDPTEFWRVLSYKRRVRDDVRSKYFSTIGDLRAVAPGTPAWKGTTTMGFAFDPDGRPDESRPLVFGSFTWIDGTLACRVPLSVAALLEANAVHFEIEAEFALIARLKKGPAAVERMLASRRWMKQLYDPELGMYSVAVHLLANHLGLSNVADAYRYTAALASIVLNLGAVDFENVTVPESLKIFGDRNQAALAARSRSYIFLLLLHHASAPNGASVRAWVDATLTAAGLDTLSQLQPRLHADREAIQPATTLVAPFEERAATNIRLGDENARLLGAVPSLKDTLKSMADLNICPVVTEDLVWNFLGKANDLHDVAAAESWHSTASRVLGVSTEFVDACG